MDFETESINLNQIINHMEESFFTEDNIIIPDVKPDILSTVNSSGNVYIYKKEIMNGKLKIDGGVLVNIMYLSDDSQSNGIRGLNTVVDFSKSIELGNIPDGCDCKCRVMLKNIECKILNGRKINVKVNLDSKINVFSDNELNIIKDSLDLSRAQMISNSLKINCLKGKGETISIAKDTISVDSEIADILDTNISVRNKDFKISYNKVLSKADVVVEIMYLTVDGRIDVSSIRNSNYGIYRYKWYI